MPAGKRGGAWPHEAPPPIPFTHRRPTTKQNGGCWAPHAGVLKEPRRLGPGGRRRRRLFEGGREAVEVGR